MQKRNRNASLDPGHSRVAVSLNKLPLAPATGHRCVVIVEDQPEFSRCLSDAVAALGAGWTALQCASGQEAKLALQRCPLDISLVLVDLGLPDVSGLEVIEFARRAQPDALILVISVISRDADVLAAIKLGARGYLHKSDPELSLIAGIKSVLDGFYPISPSLSRIIFKEISKTDVPVHVQVRLTECEIEILKLLGRGGTYAEVADHLGIKLSTIQSHVKNIYIKLETNTKMAAVEKARLAGIL